MPGNLQKIKVKGWWTATVTTNSDWTRSVKFSNDTWWWYWWNIYSGKIGWNIITNNTTWQVGTVSWKWKNSTITWSDNNNDNKNKNINLSNMSFWKDVYNAWGGYDLAWRNKQIVDIMKKNWIQATNAKSVQDFLEMYSDSYKKADDNDKLNTADKIYKLYNWIPEFEPNNESPLGDTDDWNLENYMNDEFNVWENDEPEVENFEEQYDNNLIQDYEDRIADLQSQIDSLNNKNTTEEKKWLTDEQKTANEEASAAAWNAAQWINNTETPAADTSTNVQPVVNSENYWNRWEKIMNVLSNLWYKIGKAPSEQAAEAETSNILEWWETAEQADTQAQIAESNATGWEVTPEYTDETWLVTSYEKAFDDLLAWWTTPENVQKAVETYLQAKDAAALFTVQNNLSDEAYQNMLKKIKWNNSLRVLLQNYNK